MVKGKDLASSPCRLRTWRRPPLRSMKPSIRIFSTEYGIRITGVEILPGELRLTGERLR